MECQICYRTFRDCTCQQVWMDMQLTVPRPMKPTVTFGLAGCEAVLIVHADHIILGHYSPLCKNKLDQLVKSAPSDAYIYVRTPGEYVKQNNSKYIMQPKRLFPDHVCVSPYSLSRMMVSMNYDTALHVREKDGNIEHTDELGRWIQVLFT